MSPFKKIYNAAKNKNFSLIQTILEEDGVSIDVENNRSQTPTELLLYDGEYETVKQLNHRFQINITRIARSIARKGHAQLATYLIDNYDACVNNIAKGAVEGGNPQLTQYLIDNYNANVNDIGFYAAVIGNIEFARELLNNHGADSNYIADGAAIGGYIEFARELLNSHGANASSIAYGAALGGNIKFALELLNNHGANVNHIARGTCEAGNIKFARNLLNNYDANVNDMAEGATLGGHIAFALDLLNNHGADVNHIARFAVLGKNMKFAFELLNNHGADVNHIAYYAGESGNIEFVRKLLNNYGANVNNITMGAVIGGHIELALELHNNHDADINHIANVIGSKYVSTPQGAYQLLLHIKNSKNRKALIQALKNSEITDLVKNELTQIDLKIDNIYKFKNTYAIQIHQAVFLQASPEIRIFMMQCYGPLIRGDFKVKNENDELVKSPSHIPPDIIWHICLFLAPAFMSSQAVENLLFKLQQKTLVSALDAYTNKPKGLVSVWFKKEPPHLNRAISFKNAASITSNLESMKALVNQQVGLFANINKYNAQGKTPLIIAIENGDLEKTIYLLKQGSNPDIPQQSNKHTPLALAILAGHTEIIDVLLQYHAQPGLADKYGITPYQLALQIEDKEILDKLDSVLSTINSTQHEEPLCENEYEQDRYYLALKQSQARIT